MWREAEDSHLTLSRRCQVLLAPASSLSVCQDGLAFYSSEICSSLHLKVTMAEGRWTAIRPKKAQSAILNGEKHQ